MQVIKEEGSRPIKAWVGAKTSTSVNEASDAGQLNKAAPWEVPDIEDAALKQAKNLARLPFLHPNGLALMPDVHAGIGSTVGSVIATRKAIVPAAVGVDIGCGMNAVRLSLKASDLPDSLLEIRHQIERDVPLGAGGRHNDERSRELCNAQREIMDIKMPRAVDELVTDYYKTAGQLGTLGSGNHFIELCVDENQDVWVMLHSGSRGIGNLIGRTYIEKAKREMERWHTRLEDPDLAYLPEGSPLFDDYIAAMTWAQDYATANRMVMMQLVLAALRRTIAKPFELTSEAISCHHNYTQRENHFGENVWLTRKGAVSARQDQLGIIPGSMGTRSYIVRGKGNPESYCSCSHGAGRRMSRTEARRRYQVADLVRLTEGVECRKDDAVLDELPAAYKDIDEVMANQVDLVEVVHTLKAVLCVKGA